MPLVLRDELFLEHDPGPAHPENPGRLRAIYADLDAHPLPGVVTEQPNPAQQVDLERIHSPDYLSALLSIAGRSAQLDPDTAVSPRSYEAALLAAGATVRAADAVISGRFEGAFALVRPPGHHAEAERAMGFCLLNNVAIAAAHAIDEQSCKRVLILDPDVHHGNGTQWAFWNRRDVLYVSSHRFPFYPGTGAIAELGDALGLGYTVNLPLPGGAGDPELFYVYKTIVEPIVKQFEPDLILVSAGFDTWRNDPLGGMSVSQRGFAALFSLYQSWAQTYCMGRIAYALEGGYDPEGLVLGVRAALSAMSGVAAPPIDWRPTPAVESVVGQSRALLAPYWSSLKG